MEWVGWDFSLELILFSSLFNIWARSGAVVASPSGPARHPKRAEPSPSIPTGRDLRKWGIWSIPGCAEGEEPPGSLSQREDERSKLLDHSLFFFFSPTSNYNYKIISGRWSDSSRSL